MKRVITVKEVLFCLVLSYLFAGTIELIHAQPKPSFSASYDLFPYQNFKDPEVDGQNAPQLEDAQIQSYGITLQATYPLIFSEGRTVIINELNFQNREFSYDGFTATPLLDDIYAINYTLMLQHVLSPKWTLLSIVTPGIASDLEAELSSNDFTFQAVALFIRQVSERFSYGIGAAYSTDFGQPIPMPVLALNWNNGNKLSWNTILPVSSELLHQTSEKLQLGLVLGLDGGNYHGDPDIFETSDPELRYSVMTFGPTARFRLSNLLQLNVNAGVIGYHRFEFFAGNDEVGSYNLKPSAFFRAGFQFGG